jgi:hypothetical protein
MARRLVVLRFLRRWHARIGIAAVLFFLILAATGVALNHGHDLRLDGRYVHLSWLARWYGVKVEPPQHAFRSGRHELVAANGRWLLDGRVSGENLPRPIGVAEMPDLFVVASDATMYVYRHDGELVERMERLALPVLPLQAVGSSGGKLVLKTASGTFASADAVSWQRTAERDISWSQPARLTDADLQRLRDMLTPGITLQQVLLDLHSGRIFGRYGEWFVDLIAAMLAVLSLIGGWLFLMPRHRRERH